MKVKTFRNILLAILAVVIIYRFFIPFSLEDIIFRNKENTLFEYADIELYTVIFSVPIFAAAAVSFYRNRYNVMTKKGIWIMSLVFAFLILLPVAKYPSRTEITSETITTHNFSGQPSNVYKIEDAERVTVGLETTSVTSPRSSYSSSYMWFVYRVEFEDGFAYDFGAPNDDKVWNEIIDSVNETVKEKGIEKIIIGERYLDPYEVLIRYDNYEEFIMPWLTRIEGLMYD